MVSKVILGSGSTTRGNPGAGVFRGLRVSRLFRNLLNVTKRPRTWFINPNQNEAGYSKGAGGNLTGVLRAGSIGWRAVGGWLMRMRSRRALSPAGAWEESSIVPLEGYTLEDLNLDEVLERNCLPRDTFAFYEIQKKVGRDAVLTLEAQSKGAGKDGDLAWCEGCLTMSEIGRQLGMLGLVAVSEMDPENVGQFYNADAAIVEEYGALMDARIPLRGVAHLHKVNGSQAKAQLEMWQKDHLLCQLSMTYKIMDSWEEVLPGSNINQ